MNTRTTHLKNVVLRLAIMALACACVAAFLSLVMWLFASPETMQPQPIRSPFGVGMRETGGGVSSASGGFGAQMMAWQSQFYRSLTQTLSRVSEQGGVLTLIGFSFAYGVFHAAGPGHGKAIISAYIVATDQQYRRGLFLSTAAACVQALMAIVIVGILALLLNRTAQVITQQALLIEKVSYAIMALVGLWVLWRRTQKWRDDRTPHTCDDGCAHGSLMINSVQDQSKTMMLAVIFAAGIRPCMGAIVVLVFALSQHIFWAGVLATFAMAVGTALTTGALASLAVFAKSFALRLAEVRSSSKIGRIFQMSISMIELLAAAFIVVLGGTLFLQSTSLI